VGGLFDESQFSTAGWARGLIMIRHGNTITTSTTIPINPPIISTAASCRCGRS